MNTARRASEAADQIIVAKQHLWSSSPSIQPLTTLDVAEVADHVAVVQRAGAHLDFRHGVVAVRMLADAVVIEQPVTVTKIDTFRDGVHGGIVS
jgi:hypothetical protein